MKPDIMRIVPITNEQLTEPHRKRDYNRALFAVVAPRYDQATRALSFFADQRWKRLLVEGLPVEARSTPLLGVAPADASTPLLGVAPAAASTPLLGVAPARSADDGVAAPSSTDAGLAPVGLAGANMAPAGSAGAESAALVLDLACGTGDITQLLAARYPAAEVVGLDLTAEMLTIARERAQAAGVERIRFVEGDMAALPYQDAAADVVTGGYALRNAPDLRKTLTEAHRVLRPGGRAAFLDFATPAFGSLRTVRLLLLTVWGRFWGRVLHGDPEVYAYIPRSMRTFPPLHELTVMAQQIGFDQVTIRPLFAGLLFIIWMNKP